MIPGIGINPSAVSPHPHSLCSGYGFKISAKMADKRSDLNSQRTNPRVHPSRKETETSFRVDRKTASFSCKSQLESRIAELILKGFFCE